MAASAEDSHGRGRKRRETAQEIICNEMAEEMSKKSGHMHKKNKKKKKDPTEGAQEWRVKDSHRSDIRCFHCRAVAPPAELLRHDLREHLQPLPADGGDPAQHGRGLRGAALHHDPERAHAGPAQVQEHDLSHPRRH